MRLYGVKNRRDQNEAAIVEALRAHGARVDRIAGSGLPDLLVGYQGRWTPLEVKSAKGSLTARQARAWTNGQMAYPVVRSVDEALQVVGIPAID